jgi:hypothetical protein
MYLFFKKGEGWSGEKLGQYWMSCAKKTFSRAIGSVALLYSTPAVYLSKDFLYI